MKRSICLIFVLSFLISGIAKEQTEVQVLTDRYSLDSIIADIESIYDLHLPLPFEHFRDSSYIKTESAIIHYFESIKRFCDIDALDEYYNEMILEAVETEFGEEETIKYASIYLMCGFRNHEHTAYQSLATAYANLRDKDNLRYVLYCFEKSEINQDGEFTDLIEQMKTNMSSILYPNSDITAYTQGFWVSNAYSVRKKNRYFPYSIIEIRSLTDDGVFAYNLPSFDNTAFLREGLGAFRMAQDVRATSSTQNALGSIGFTFNSQKLQQGINTSSGFEMTRRFQSDMQGTIAASKWSTGQKIGASAATTMAAGLMDMAMLAMAQSYHTIATMTLNLSPVSNDVMKGQMTYIYHTASTANFDVSPEPVYDDVINYIRWVPEDSVFFVNSKGKLCSVTAPENLNLAEYHRIQKWWKQVQTWTTVGSVVGGAGIMAGGISLIAKTKTTGGIVGGTLILLAGEMAALIPSILIWDTYPTKKYAALNQAQLRKLQEKHKAELSLTPAINPIDANAGVSVSIKY